MELKTSSRGHRRVLSTENIEDIRYTVEEQSGIMIREIKEKLNLFASEETIRRKVVEADRCLYPTAFDNSMTKKEEVSQRI